MNSWSSKQRLSQKALVSLAKDLESLSMKLSNMDYNKLDTMKKSNSTTLDTILTNLNTNLGKEQLVNLARYSTRRRRFTVPVKSIKNYAQQAGGLTGSNTEFIFAKAVNTPLSTINTDVSQGCTIRAVWISFDVCGLGGTGVLNVCDAYIWKNPGNNLTAPLPFTYGTSNEKKFIFKTFRGMIMRNQDGNAPYHWEGWLKIPKRYQRMGTDDIMAIEMNCTAGVTAHFSFSALYKWLE